MTGRRKEPGKEEGSEATREVPSRKSRRKSSHYRGREATVDAELGAFGDVVDRVFPHVEFRNSACDAVLQKIPDTVQSKRRE